MRRQFEWWQRRAYLLKGQPCMLKGQPCMLKGQPCIEPPVVKRGGRPDGRWEAPRAPGRMRAPASCGHGKRHHRRIGCSARPYRGRRTRGRATRQSRGSLNERGPRRPSRGTHFGFLDEDLRSLGCACRVSTWGVPSHPPWVRILVRLTEMSPGVPPGGVQILVRLTEMSPGGTSQRGLRPPVLYTNFPCST